MSQEKEARKEKKIAVREIPIKSCKDHKFGVEEGKKKRKRL